MASSFLSLFFALRVGAFGISYEAPQLSIREEARKIAAVQTALGALVTPGPASSTGPAASLSGANNPEEWISAVTHGLQLQDEGITHAAMWIASAPVQLDVGTQHVFLTVRFHN